MKLSNSLVGIVYSIAGFGSLIAVTLLSTFLNKKDTIFAPFGGILAAYFNWLLNPRLSLVILGLLSSLLVILIKSYEKKLTKKRTAIFIKED